MWPVLDFPNIMFFTSPLDAQRFRRRFQPPHEATGVDWWIEWTLREFLAHEKTLPTGFD